jgi:hypothetical protein
MPFSAPGVCATTRSAGTPSPHPAEIANKAAQAQNVRRPNVHGMMRILLRKERSLTPLKSGKW